MKLPTNVLGSEIQTDRRDSTTSTSDRDTRTPAGNDSASTAEYGDFVHNLTQSIVQRNARARRGPGRDMEQKARSKRTLHRVLSTIMNEETPS